MLDWDELLDDFDWRIRRQHRRRRRPPWDDPNHDATQRRRRPGRPAFVSRAGDAVLPTATEMLIHSDDEEDRVPRRPAKRLRRSHSFAEAAPPREKAHRWNDLTTKVQQGACERATPSGLSQINYWDRLLPPQLQLQVLQFATVQDLVAVRRLDRARRRLLLSLEAAAAVWKPACQRRWPWMDWDDSAAVVSDIMRVGGGGTTTTTVNNNTNVTFAAAAAPAADYARILLDWAAAHCSHKVDASRFPRDIIQFVTDENQTAIQYMGVVGPNNRCVRAATPLPRPAARILVRAAAAAARPQHGGGGGASSSSSLDQQQQLARMAEWQPYVEQWKPFVAPYALSPTSVSLQPRLVSYFEVTLLPPVEPPPEPTIDHHRRRRHGLLARSGATHARHRERADCVAVGVARDEFFRYYRNRMPGWTVNSHGYHSDDGNYYHGGGHPAVDNGTMPQFGDGDCVGCGIDYVQGRVFFCKNGARLMSYPLGDDEALSHDWYPVVGLDSRCPVTVNFGTRTPFQFDLAAYVASHQHDQVATRL